MAPVIHLVLFQFQSNAAPDEVESVCHRMVALEEECVRTDANGATRPYLKLVTGGRDNSPEGLQGGLTHAFMVEFESEEDRDYYVWQDPAHVEFKRFARDVIHGVTVLDFTPGQF